jgi:ABC-type branched-subunit amino acid transport system ATPase component
VSITVGTQEIVTVIGPNGAGKSTLLRAILGLLTDVSGRVLLRDEDVSRAQTEERIQLGLGFVPQTENVFPSLTVRENLEMGGYIRNAPLADRLAWVMEMFPDIKGRMDERAGRLSGGQRQMVAIGRAMMLEPAIMLLDEPSASLSPQMSEVVFDRIAAINRQGMSVLLVEQNAKHALSISDRGYVMAGGQNRLEGPARDLLARDDVRRHYLGG